MQSAYLSACLANIHYALLYDNRWENLAFWPAHLLVNYTQTVGDFLKNYFIEV